MARELALIALALVACGKDSKPEDKPVDPPVVKGGAPPLAAKDFFRIDGTPPSCKSGATCEVRFVLSALGDYHVNDEYPHKFVPDTGGELEIEGEGAFARQGEKTGTMTVKVKAAKPGISKLKGTFKLSVCNAENCQIEAPKVQLHVTAS